MKETTLKELIKELQKIQDPGNVTVKVFNPGGREYVNLNLDIFDYVDYTNNKFVKKSDERYNRRYLYIESIDEV